MILYWPTARNAVQAMGVIVWAGGFRQVVVPGPYCFTVMGKTSGPIATVATTAGPVSVMAKTAGPQVASGGCNCGE